MNGDGVSRFEVRQIHAELFSFDVLDDFHDHSISSNYFTAVH